MAKPLARYARPIFWLTLSAGAFALETRMLLP